MKRILLFTLFTHALSAQALSIQNSMAIVFLCSQVKESQKNYPQDVKYSEVPTEDQQQLSDDPPSTFGKYCGYLQKRRDQLMRRFVGDNQK